MTAGAEEDEEQGSGQKGVLGGRRRKGRQEEGRVGVSNRSFPERREKRKRGEEWRGVGWHGMGVVVGGRKGRKGELCG